MSFVDLSPTSPVFDIGRGALRFSDESRGETHNRIRGITHLQVGKKIFLDDGEECFHIYNMCIGIPIA